MTHAPGFDSDAIPEGLNVQSGREDWTLDIVDAQGHVWVTLHDKAFGDPIEWRTGILERIMDALGIEGENRVLGD